MITLNRLMTAMSCYLYVDEMAVPLSMVLVYLCAILG